MGDTLEQWRRKEAKNEHLRNKARGERRATSYGYFPRGPLPPEPFDDEEQPVSSWYMISRVDKCEKAMMRRPMYAYWVVLEDLFGDPFTYRKTQLTRHGASL